MKEDKDKLSSVHHWLDGYEFEQALGVGAGQGSLACCSPWGHKESDTTEQLNWTEGQIPLKPQTTRAQFRKKGLHSGLQRKPICSKWQNFLIRNIYCHLLGYSFLVYFCRLSHIILPHSTGHPSPLIAVWG